VALSIWNSIPSTVTLHSKILENGPKITKFRETYRGLALIRQNQWYKERTCDGKTYHYLHTVHVIDNMLLVQETQNEEEIRAKVGRFEDLDKIVEFAVTRSSSSISTI
jgi:hypothetical protein